MMKFLRCRETDGHEGAYTCIGGVGGKKAEGR